MSAPVLRMTVSMRIYLIIGFTILGMSIVTMLATRSIEGSLMDARREQTRRIVEIATTLTAEYKARAKTGEMTVEEAQKRALQRISTLRYDETN